MENLEKNLDELYSLSAYTNEYRNKTDFKSEYS